MHRNGRTLAPAIDLRPAPLVEVVVPVHNEQRALPDSIRRLHDFLSAELPFSWRITIADNASTDQTPWLARALARDLEGVRVLTLTEKGRGRALRAAWTQSDAAVRCYMDVDLSTDLRALLPLVAPLVSGHSDVAIGTRLARGSRVVRGPKRELISRGYNRLLHLSLAARFSDAQCGFKAIRADAAERLLPQVADQAWFFDTELLVLAQREGLRIHEVPVDWTDDPDSTVDIARTAIDDLKGIGRLLLARARHHARGLAVFVLTLALTTGALAVLHAIDARPSAGLELAVLVTAGVSATVTRFVALRSWVFARRSSPPTAGSAGEAASSRPTTAAPAFADHRLRGR